MGNFTLGILLKDGHIEPVLGMQMQRRGMIQAKDKTRRQEILHFEAGSRKSQRLTGKAPEFEGNM